MNDELETVTGTLHYVTGYTQFSGTEAEQSGNYLALKVDSTAEELYVKDTAAGEYTELDDSGITVMRITNKNTQKLYVKAVADYLTTEFVYDLSGLTLEEAPAETTEP